LSSCLPPIEEEKRGGKKNKKISGMELDKEQRENIYMFIPNLIGFVSYPV